jgi:glutamine amidotransferase
MTAIVDYGMANLRSVRKAVERVGGTAEVTADPERVARAERLILPGVGAFRDAMQRLRESGLAEAICSHIRSGRPFLGICLGLQLLFERSHEGGEHDGLGVLPGEVARLRGGPGVKVPHMGWSLLRILRPAPMLTGFPAEPYVYFVHSYQAVPREAGLTAAEADHGGPVCAAVWRDNVFATQFHPEKSQRVGLHLLERFLHWRP